MNTSDETIDLAMRLGEQLIAKQWTVTTAESCTGGLVSAALTAVPGSSAWFHGALVTYSNDVKAAWLGVPEAVLDSHGAVSRETVSAMAAGASKTMRAELAVAISGIAGPDGGVPGKPVGTVWIAVATGQSIDAVCHHFAGDRKAVRQQAVISALRATLSACVR